MILAEIDKQVDGAAKLATNRLDALLLHARNIDCHENKSPSTNLYYMYR